MRLLDRAAVLTRACARNVRPGAPEQRTRLSMWRNCCSKTEAHLLPERTFWLMVGQRHRFLWLLAAGAVSLKEGERFSKLVAKGHLPAPATACLGQRHAASRF